MTHRSAQRDRKRRSLKSVSSAKPSLVKQAWFRGLSVLTVFTTSLTIAYSVASVTPAQAISMPSISSLQTMIRSVMQADALNAAFQVTTAQTARYPRDVARFMNEASARNAAITTGADQGYKLVDIHLDMQPGIGLSENMLCAANAERKVVLVRDAATESDTSQKMQITTGQYAATDSAKQGARARTHLGHYCDISEVNQGVCLPRADGLGGADSNYSVITHHKRLTPETEAAAYAFMYNVIDPTQTQENSCETLACSAVDSHQRVYQALASMSHNTYINQINSALIYNPGGKNHGLTSAEVLAQTSKAQAPVITTSPDGTITTVTNNANGTVTTTIQKPDGTTTNKTVDKDGKPADPGTPKDDTKPKDDAGKDVKTTTPDSKTPATPKP